MMMLKLKIRGKKEISFIKHNMGSNINVTKRIRTFIPLVDIIIPNENTFFSVKRKLMGVISIKVGKTSATKGFKENIIRKGAKESMIWKRDMEDRCEQLVDEKCGSMKGFLP